MHHERTTEHLLGDPGVIGWPGQVVGGVYQPEEEHAHCGQNAALVGNCAVQDEVVRRDPIGGDQQQVMVVDAVNLTNLAAGDMLVIGQRGSHRVSLSGEPAPFRGELCWYRSHDKVPALLHPTPSPVRSADQRHHHFAVDGDLGVRRYGRTRCNRDDRRGRPASGERLERPCRQPGVGGARRAQHSAAG